MCALTCGGNAPRRPEGFIARQLSTPISPPDVTSATCRLRSPTIFAKLRARVSSSKSRRRRCKVTLRPRVVARLYTAAITPLPTALRALLRQSRDRDVRWEPPSLKPLMCHLAASVAPWWLGRPGGVTTCGAAAIQPPLCFNRCPRRMWVGFGSDPTRPDPVPDVTFCPRSPASVPSVPAAMMSPQTSEPPILFPLASRMSI